MTSLPLVMYKGGRPQNSIWEHFLHVAVGNKKYAMQSTKRVIISKLIMLPECPPHKRFNGFSLISFN